MTSREDDLLIEVTAICTDDPRVVVVNTFDSITLGFDQTMFADADHLNTMGHRRLAEIIQSRMDDSASNPAGVN